MNSPGDFCLGPLCFFRLSANTPILFGFSDFLTGLALIILAWTTADVRYRFRLRTAPVPLQETTFAVVSGLGVLTLATDLWRAEQWPVPYGFLLTPAEWQVWLAGVFLLTFLMWAWFAFIRPPIYGTWNAKRFRDAIYGAVLRSSPAELAVVADELARSSKALVQLATDRKELRGDQASVTESTSTPLTLSNSRRYANHILLLIADRRFCRAVVEAAPGTALALFLEIERSGKYRIPIEIFAKNLIAEAFRNEDSFLFHETGPYESGLLGYRKPLSQAIFANSRMVEAIGTLLDCDLRDRRAWTARQWKSYSRIVLTTLRDHVQKDFGSHSAVLYRAKRNIESSVSDVYKLDGLTTIAWDDDIRLRLEVAIEYIQSAVAILDEKGVPSGLSSRPQSGLMGNMYDHLSEMVVEIIYDVSAVRAPWDQCWWIQHNSVWSELFNVDHLDTPAGRVVKAKVCRLLIKDIADMTKFPNFKGARILAFCLNVMGLRLSENREYDRDSRALHRLVLAWTRRHFAWLHAYNPRIADACLVDGTTYDPHQHRLVRTLPAGLRREPEFVYLNVDEPSRCAPIVVGT